MTGAPASPPTNGVRRLTRGWWVFISAVAVVAIALGWIGIERYGLQLVEAGEVDGPFHWSTVLFGVVLLFAIETDLEDVPWELAIARLLAALATVLVVVSVVIRAARAYLAAMWFRRLGRGHNVLVGPRDRLRPYALGGHTWGQRVVQLGPEAGESTWRMVQIPSLGYSDDRWIVKSGAQRAAHVVLATGSDHDNLDLLAGLLAHREIAAHRNARATAQSIRVEIDDRDTALQLQLSIGLRLRAAAPEVSVDVICPTASRALIAAERLVSKSGSCPAVAVVGDGPTTAALTVSLAERFANSPTLESGRRPLLLVAPECNDATRLLLEARLDISSRFEVEVHESVERLFDRSRGITETELAVFVEFADADRAAAVSVDMVGRRPSWRVYLATSRSGRPLQHLGFRGLKSFAAASGTDDRLTSGLFTLVAMDRHEAKRRRTAGGPDAGWASLTEDQRLAARTQVVAGVGALIDFGLRLAPLIDRRAEQPDGYRPCTELTSSQRAALERLGLGEDADDFPTELRRAGILLLEPDAYRSSILGSGAT